jgi:hypothetical protein
LNLAIDIRVSLNDYRISTKESNMKLRNTPCITSANLLLLAHSFNQVTTERAALLLLPSLNKRQRARLWDLNGALDSFENYLGDLGAVPSGACLAGALKAA